MVIIAKKIWDWAIKHQVQVSAEHLPGKQNVTADKLSRELNDNLEWSLDREVFCKLIRKAGFRPQVDLFATRLNAQVQKFVSWKQILRRGKWTHLPSIGQALKRMRFLRFVW